MIQRLHTQRNWVILLAFLHLVGMVAFQTPLKDLFLLFTPLTLMLSFYGIFAFMQGDSQQRLLLFITVWALGYGVEVLGIQTGFPFGEYSYGNVLGIKLFDTPLIIGINWFIMFAGSAYASQKLKINFILQAAVAASLMTITDLFLEPVAIEYGFWTWEQISVPVSNYVAWWVIAFIIQCVYHVGFKKVTLPPSALGIYIVFSLFFIILNFI